MTQEINLASLFQTVTQTLAQNQSALDQADEYNHDHGTNMVNTFQAITRAVQAKQGKPPSTALAYAAKQISKISSSGSSQLYAQGLAQAAQQFKGKEMDTRGAMQLLQTLIGGGQPAQSSGGDMLSTLLSGMASGGQTQAQPSAGTGDDLLGALLGGMASGGQSQSQPSAGTGDDLLGALLGGMASGGQSQSQPPAGAGDDLLGSLLGGLVGGGESAPTSSNQSSGLDIGDLLNAGMAFMQTQQSGGSTMESLVQAFAAASGMGNTSHRNQSTSLVIKAFLQALSSLSKR